MEKTTSQSFWLNSTIKGGRAMEGLNKTAMIVGVIAMLILSVMLCLLPKNSGQSKVKTNAQATSKIEKVLQQNIYT